MEWKGCSNLHWVLPDASMALLLESCDQLASWGDWLPHTPLPPAPASPWQRSSVSIRPWCTLKTFNSYTHNCELQGLSLSLTFHIVTTQIITMYKSHISQTLQLFSITSAELTVCNMHGCFHIWSFILVKTQSAILHRHKHTHRHIWMHGQFLLKAWYPFLNVIGLLAIA